MIKLIACLMVRNEGKIIERCLRAALPHVDAVVIAVNNTTDDTVEKARAIIEEFGTPSRLVTEAWKNFGHNRTNSFRWAKLFAVERGFDLSQTYALLLDGDHVLRVDDAFDRNALTMPAYELDTSDGSIFNPNVRLLRLDHDWACVGVTHEFWRPTPDTWPGSLDTMRIQDMCDGGSKDDKHPRDIALLLKGLEDEPTNERYMFYLGESYFNSGQYEKAVEWYQKRWAAGGWDEEKWFARFKMGLALLRLGETSVAARERGIGALVEAFAERSGRAESPIELATHFRNRGQSQLAMIFTDLARGRTNQDRLLVARDTERRVLEETAISAFYVPGREQDGLEACETLLEMHGQSGAHYEHWAVNESFYLKPVSAVRRGTFPLPPEILECDGIPYRGTNPCIIKGEGDAVDTIVHVRLVNYEHTGGRSYRAFDPRNIFRTRGARMFWSPSTGWATSAVEVVQHLPDDWPKDIQITGLEDQRWAWHDGRVWFTATCCQVPGAGGRPLVVLGLMNKELNAVERVMKLEYEHVREYEKNWAPWSLNGDLLLVYSYEPFVVLKVDTTTGKCEEVCRWTAPKRFARWRGSSSPIRTYLGGWMLIIHEVAYRATENIYAHRAVLIDSDKMQITDYTRPFVFDRIGVEYCAGLIRGATDDNVIITYGAEDKEPRYVEVNPRTLQWEKL